MWDPTPPASCADGPWSALPTGYPCENGGGKSGVPMQSDPNRFGPPGIRNRISLRHPESDSIVRSGETDRDCVCSSCSLRLRSLFVLWFPLQNSRLVSVLHLSAFIYCLTCLAGIDSIKLQLEKRRGTWQTSLPAIGDRVVKSAMKNKTRKLMRSSTRRVGTRNGVEME